LKQLLSKFVALNNMQDPALEMFSLFEMTPDLVCIAGKDGFFRHVNPAVLKKLGYSKEELFALPISSNIHPEDKEITAKTRAKLLEGKALINFQNRYITKKGAIVWLEWTSIYIPDKELVFAIAKDITKRKLAEKEIEAKYQKFKSLATHFKQSIEKDKKSLAIELHEELAQLASVVKMDIDMVSAYLPESEPNIKNRLDHALMASDLLINTIRRISFSISPDMIEDVGLNETIKWLCAEFSKLNSIPCQFETVYNEVDLTHEIKLDFFRICQQALSNVMYHAEAANVYIGIQEIGNEIQLTITDNGKGFNIQEHVNSTGLTNMRERAASINSRLIIESEQGKGTKVTCIHSKKS
jgi:PAS domain S-box-containing protein